ncbi:MAG: hypothetical protein IT469_06060 [Pseudomonadales bacterium]|nr:hypothetical protein [Pseudomonadales bacterium]
MATAQHRSAPPAAAPILIRHTEDGRRVEAIDRWICLDGRREADALVEVRSHPNRAAISQAVPDATHMAGRIPLTADQATRAQAALDEARAAYEASPLGIAERMRHAADGILRLRIDE